MKWVQQKIISKAIKLPWIEIYPTNDTIERKSEFEVFFSEPDHAHNTEVKSSLNDVLSMYDQNLNYDHDANFTDNPVSTPILSQKFDFSHKVDENPENNLSFQPLSHLRISEKMNHDIPKAHGIINYHYSKFDYINANESSENDLKNIVYNISNINTPNTSLTSNSYKKENLAFGYPDIPKDKHVEKNIQNMNPVDSVTNSNKGTEYLVNSDLNFQPESPYNFKKSNDDDGDSLLNESNNAVETPVLNKNQELFDISISRSNLIPKNEEFLLNPLTAENYYSTEDHTEKEELSETNFENEELIEPAIENQDPAESPDDSRQSFRCSVTPEVKTNQQFHIPFNVLRTGADEYEHTDPAEVQQIIEKLESTLDQFGIEARVIGMQRGPIITRYEIRIPPGIKVNRILSLTDELAMALEALRVRIEAPIPGRSTVGIEIPNKKRSTVLLGDILNHPDYNGNSIRLPLPLGKDIAGNLLIEDLSRMPHILIAGATGSGKSVAINSFITSMIITKSPEEVRMLMVDPKLVELSQYNDIPHLLHPVIADAQKAILALNWAVEEMDRRYEDMADMRARDIVSYNLKVDQHNKTYQKSDDYIPKMPYIVILIDELGDLMMVAGKEVESSIIRLSQKARAIGIHLILATQRPSVDVITALIKANCPARIALQVAQKTDSRTILDSNGGEQLLGQGDMLFKHPSRAQLIRAQAPYVSDQEVENVVNMVKKLGKPSYIVLEDPKAKSGELELEDENLFDEAWGIIVESNKASASYLQRRLRIGYNRAARIIEAFEARGYIGPQVGSKPREIFIHN